jgi:hypothetical protein
LERYRQIFCLYSQERVNMARLLALVCVLAVCSAASARLLLQVPADPVATLDADGTIPVEASPVPLDNAVLTSPGPIVAALPVNDTAVVPAVLVPVANTTDAATGTPDDAGNTTTPAFATFADAVAAANSTAANLTIIAALIEAAGGYSSMQQTVVHCAHWQPHVAQALPGGCDSVCVLHLQHSRSTALSCW